MNFNDAFETLASEAKRMNEMLDPVGRIRCNAEDTEYQRRQQEALEQEIRRIEEELSRPRMGDIDVSYYKLKMEERKQKKW